MRFPFTKVPSARIINGSSAIFACKGVSNEKKRKEGKEKKKRRKEKKEKEERGEKVRLLNRKHFLILSSSEMVIFLRVSSFHFISLRKLTSLNKKFVSQ